MALSEEIDKIPGLKAGAYDSLIKRFRTQERTAHSNALRAARYQIPPGAKHHPL